MVCAGKNKCAILASREEGNEAIIFRICSGCSQLRRIEESVLMAVNSSGGGVLQK